MQDEQDGGVKALHQNAWAVALAVAAHCVQKDSSVIPFPFEGALVVNPEGLWERAAWKGIAAIHPKLAG